MFLEATIHVISNLDHYWPYFGSPNYLKKLVLESWNNDSEKIKSFLVNDIVSQEKIS